MHWMMGSLTRTLFQVSLTHSKDEVSLITGGFSTKSKLDTDERTAQPYDRAQEKLPSQLILIDIR